MKKFVVLFFAIMIILYVYVIMAPSNCVQSNIISEDRPILVRPIYSTSNNQTQNNPTQNNTMAAITSRPIYKSA